MTIRTILVDDEPLATQGLQLRLQAHDDIEVVATAANGREAIRQVKTHKPDLVFLDIQMPGFDGFSVIQGLMDVELPLFVFVTAFVDHALRAFDAQAVDYLMKPVDEDRLAATMDRVRQRLSERRSAEEAGRLKEALAEHAPEAAEELADSVSDAPASNRYEKMINIKDQGQIFRVDVDTIERIDAAGDYMCIQTGDNTLILRETMKDLEKRLDPRRFQRVHRSTIVNLDLVRQVKPHTNGECFLVLDSGAQVKVSRSYRDVVARFVHEDRPERQRDGPRGPPGPDRRGFPGGRAVHCRHARRFGMRSDRACPQHGGRARDGRSGRLRCRADGCSHSRRPGLSIVRNPRFERRPIHPDERLCRLAVGREMARPPRLQKPYTIEQVEKALTELLRA